MAQVILHKFPRPTFHAAPVQHGEPPLSPADGGRVAHQHLWLVEDLLNRRKPTCFGPTHRGRSGRRGKGPAFGPFLAPNGYWDIEGEPYTVAPGNDFRWFRSRILGGRTNHYGRISLRMGPSGKTSSSK